MLVSEDPNEPDPGLEKQNNPDLGLEKATAPSLNSVEHSNQEPSSDQESLVEKTDESDEKESVGQVKNSIDIDSVDSNDQIKGSSEQSKDSGDQIKESSDQQKESNDQVQDAEKVEDSEENVANMEVSSTVANMDVSSTVDETADESMDIDEPEAASKNQTGDECENIAVSADPKEKSKSINGDPVDKEEKSEKNESNVSGASKEADNGSIPEKESETVDTQSEEIDMESKKKESSKETEKEKEDNNEEEKEDKSSDKNEEKKMIGEKPMIMMFVNETEADEEKELEEESEKDVDEKKKDLKEEKEVGEEEKKKDPGEAQRKDESKTTKEDSAMETDEKMNGEAKESKETPDKSKIESEVNSLKEAKKEIPTETPTDKEEEKKEDKKKPTLKLASFADMANSSVEKKVETNLDIDESVEYIDETRIDASGCCSDCQLNIESLKSAVVWETMQFCNITCLAKYQSGLSRYETGAKV